SVVPLLLFFFFFFSSRRRHTRFSRDWSSDVCSSDLHYLYYTHQYTYSTLIQAHDHAPLSCFPWRHCPSLLAVVSLQRSTDGGRATPPGTGHPAPARQRPGTQLPRRGAGPPRTRTGVPHRRQGHPAPGRGR